MCGESGVLMWAGVRTSLVGMGEQTGNRAQNTKLRGSMRKNDVRLIIHIIKAGGSGSFFFAVKERERAGSLEHHLLLRCSMYSHCTKMRRYYSRLFFFSRGKMCYVEFRAPIPQRTAPKLVKECIWSDVYTKHVLIRVHSSQLAKPI